MLMHMHPEGIYSDNGTVLDTDEAAIVTEEKGTKVALLLPFQPDKNVPVPSAILYITACALRATAEPEFVEEMIEWLTNQQKQAH